MDRLLFTVTNSQALNPINSNALPFNKNTFDLPISLSAKKFTGLSNKQ